jgi:hypothetical protein
MDIADIRCLAAGCDSQVWRDRWHFCSMLDISAPNLLDPRGPRGGAVPREIPLDDDR